MKDIEAHRGKIAQLVERRRELQNTVSTRYARYLLAMNTWALAEATGFDLETTRKIYRHRPWRG
ncbi:hypothetical protein DSECCO2_584160 [anaerobic digester metagenome]